MSFTVPYAARRQYEPDTNTIAGLIQRSGARQADLALRQGEISAQKWGSLGQIASQGLSGYMADKEAQKVAEAKVREAQRLADEKERIEGPKRKLDEEKTRLDMEKTRFDMERAKDAQIREKLNADEKDELDFWSKEAAVMLDLGATPEVVQSRLEQAKALGRVVPPQFESSMTNPAVLKRLAQFGGIKFEDPKAPEGYSLSPGMVRFGPDNKPVASAPRAPSEPKTESKFWVMRPGTDGKLQSVRISESEYRPGDQPASTREQGRPVTAGDAGRFAELDSSLDDLKILKDTLGTTGAGSKVGAMLPNVVTEYTGWGSDSKQRQATIDRVKQVIGKALESGVLRKEDELKYTKILPTIGDPPEVAKAKIEGLAVAIAQRKQRELEARQDAGYDVSKFLSRQAPAPKKIGRFIVEEDR